MQTVLADTCFWIGLVDTTDQYHKAANEIADLIDNNKIILPWPCLYETMSTHLARRKERLLYFERLISKSSVELLDDSNYKFNALKETFILNQLGFTYSLTDSVIREILKDINIRIRYLVTFNATDFEDICQRRKITILP